MDIDDDLRARIEKLVEDKFEELERQRRDGSIDSNGGASNSAKRYFVNIGRGRLAITDDLRADIEKMVADEFGDLARYVEMEMTDEFSYETFPGEFLYVKVYFEKGLTREKMQAMGFASKFGKLRGEIIKATQDDVYPGYTIVRMMKAEDADHGR